MLHKNNSEKIGELTVKIPKSVGGRPEKNSSVRADEFLEKKPKTQIIKEMGFNTNQVRKEALSHGATQKRSQRNKARQS
jgi:hypothetical protein